MNSRSKEKALLVTDAKGHIIDRIGRSWCNRASVTFDLARSEDTSVADCCRLASEAGLVHWLDFRRFCHAGKAVDVPQIATVHHVMPDDWSKAAACLELADAIVAISKRWQDHLHRKTSRHVGLIPHSIDTQAFPMRTREALVGDPFMLGFLGKGKANLDDRKGTALLIEILTVLRTENFAFEFLLVGPGWDNLAGRISQMGVRVHRMQFATTEETVAAYARMDALVVTASEEGGPVTILEAMSCGVPVVTSDVGHVPEVIRDGETGFVCKKRLVSEYVYALQALRSHPKLVTKITREARSFVEQHRDDAVVIPRINFADIFAEARNHFTTLSPGEVAMRRAKFKMATLRQAAAKVIRRQKS